MSRKQGDVKNAAILSKVKIISRLMRRIHEVRLVLAFHLKWMCSVKDL